MVRQATTLDERLDKMDAQLERIATAVVTGFASAKSEHESLRDELKQAETYMQEMLALGAKIDRLEKQIEQIAAHLDIKLAY